jgi:hypothetical protein
VDFFVGAVHNLEAVSQFRPFCDGAKVVSFVRENSWNPFLSDALGGTMHEQSQSECCENRKEF